MGHEPSFQCTSKVEGEDERVEMSNEEKQQLKGLSLRPATRQQAGQALEGESTSQSSCYPIIFPLPEQVRKSDSARSSRQVLHSQTPSPSLKKKKQKCNSRENSYIFSESETEINA